jgi:hypothetical protein
MNRQSRRSIDQKMLRDALVAVAKKGLDSNTPFSDARRLMVASAGVVCELAAA